MACWLPPAVDHHPGHGQGLRQARDEVSDPNVRHHLASPRLVSMWRKTRAGGAAQDEAHDEVLLELRFADELHVDYGAPSTAWVRYTASSTAAPLPPAAPGAGAAQSAHGTAGPSTRARFGGAANAKDPGGDPQSRGSRRLAVEVSLLNKTATRLPEAMFVTFDPPPLGQSKPRWAMQKLSTWMRPEETLDGGAKGLHAVSDAGVRCTRAGAAGVLGVQSLDAALLRWGEPTPFPNPCLGPVNTTGGASFVLFNNMYNTNYVFWWPFGADPTQVHGSIKYRFALALEG